MDLDAIGPYRVLETLAHDRITVTVRARRGDEPTVRIKLPRPGLTDVAVAARTLEREAERLGALRHPSWPALVEVLRDGGRPALVCVDTAGHGLDVVLARGGALRPPSALAIALEVASAMAAHARAGGEHGLLAVDRIELTPQGAVILYPADPADDGIADLSAPENLTPEQLVGERADPRSDVFLVGALLYRMLAGAGPFDGEREGQSQRIRHHAAPSLRRGGRDISRTLDAIVQQSLAKRRHDRYPDLATFSAALVRELGRRSSLPRDVLITGALADVGLAEAVPGPRDPTAARGTALPWRRALPFFGVAALVLGLAVAVVVVRSRDDMQAAGASGPRGIVDEPGHLRVLARPWAEIVLDGRRVDVTPIGAPLDVPPGKHTVVLRHPAAPEETRAVELVAGQLVVVDVDMAVALPPPSASGSSSPMAPGPATSSRAR